MRKWWSAVAVAVFVLATTAAVAVAAELPVPDPPPSDVQKKATSILDQAQFAPAKKTLMERVVSWLVDKLKVPFTKAAGGNTVIGYLILAAFVAALVVVLSRLRFRLPEKVAPAEDILAIEIAENRSSDAWRADAERYEAAGAWKDALRARYRWMIARLVEQQTLAGVPGRTAGEYRRDVALTMPDLAAPFAAATDLFELAWYGDVPTGADENVRFRAYADRVLAAAEVRS
jgi:hypothetical protein